ncbi:hypothetical protein M8542_47885 [Amycolatopsis sp. OK19-0408]|uniref:Uncharacterized protein n=1 Tax=Amycolatopsis iheyensis TaxID=2945988 RepID=A0A9X2NP94_9PSEU|nr:hypothetical protein [Amycolatopsis iheyensis]MCR6490549.1 hypothetical protein [Amycolatopsis iheyensis]
MTEAPTPDPHAELARRRAELDELAQVMAATPPPEGFADHCWWTAEVDRYVHDEATTQPVAMAAAQTVIAWHLAWLATQPRMSRSLAYQKLGSRLAALSAHAREPSSDRREEQIDERTELSRVIADLTAILEALG